MNGYWLFNETQLHAAIKAFYERRRTEAGEHQAAIEAGAVNAFLAQSAEAREHNLIVEVASRG